MHPQLGRAGTPQKWCRGSRFLPSSGGAMFSNEGIFRPMSLPSPVKWIVLAIGVGFLFLFLLPFPVHGLP